MGSGGALDSHDDVDRRLEPSEGSLVDNVSPAAGRRVHTRGQHRRIWHGIWTRFAEIPDSAPTHFTVGTATSARNDRVFASVPSRADCGLTLRSAVLAEPMALNADGLSDHAPVEMAVLRRGMRAPEERPIARSVSRDRRFVPLLQRTVE